MASANLCIAARWSWVFVLGTRKLFEFIDENPIFELHRTAYVNDPFVIAQNERMIAINSAIQVDLTGQVVHWIEVGQPDDRRLAKASSRAEKVTVYSYIASTPIWWAALVGKLNRAPKVEVWAIDPDASQALAKLSARTMAWQITVQDGTVWVSDTVDTVEITPRLLKARDERETY